MLNTYLVMNNSADAKELSKKINGRLAEAVDSPTAGKLFLYPFKDMHLYSYRGEGGRIKTVIIFSIVAFFILIIACINFMNLATARSVKRSTEVGIKKVVGANRTQIAGQFFGESLLLTFISLIFSYKEYIISLSEALYILFLIFIVFFINYFILFSLSELTKFFFRIYISV